MDLDLFTVESYMAQCPVLEIYENTFDNIDQICQADLVTSSNSGYMHPDVFEVVWDKTEKVPMINVEDDFYRIIGMREEEAKGFTLRMLLSAIGLDTCLFRMDRYRNIMLDHILDTTLHGMQPLQFSLYSSSEVYGKSKCVSISV